MQSIPSTKGKLWERLIQRFGLEPRAPMRKEVGTLILLTSDADLMLSELKVYQTTISITVVGYRTIHTVPKKKLWTLYAAYIELTSGTWTSQDWFLYDPISGSMCPIREQTFAPTRVSGLFVPAIRLLPSWAIQVYVNDVTVAGGAQVNVLVGEEDYE